jgi:hypothetical protein
MVTLLDFEQEKFNSTLKSIAEDTEGDGGKRMSDETLKMMIECAVAAKYLRRNLLREKKKKMGIKPMRVSFKF